MEKAKVGLIVDSLSASKQINDLLLQSQSSPHYQISHLILQNTQNAPQGLIKRCLEIIGKRGLARFIAMITFRIICKIEAIYVRRLASFTTYFNQYDLATLGLEIIEVNPVISKSGFVYRYSETDINRIRDSKIDTLVRAGSGILRGDILSACPNGVISFHHADNDVNRGGPPGFWEVFKQQKKTGFVIQRLKDELDGGDILYKGYIPTTWMYTLNLASLSEISNPYLHKVLEDTARNTTTIQPRPKTPYAYPLFVMPTLGQQIKYVWAVGKAVFRKAFHKVINKQTRWGVAYQFVDDWKDVTLWRSKRIPNPKNRFLADPFAIKKGENHYCFLEDYDYGTQKGVISVWQISKENCQELGVALEEQFHLSYPFLFEFNDTLYMCPETHENKDIRLYKCVDFPLGWEYETTLTKDISAIDTNIFFKDDKWWLMTTVLNDAGIADNGSQLFVFSSDNPLSNEWQPHPANPVLFDPTRARNGGFIIEDKSLYRVFQKQGFDNYGESLGVAKITELSEEHYAEETQFEVPAHFFKDLKGTHSYNFSDGLLVLDYAQESRIR